MQSDNLERDGQLVPAQPFSRITKSFLFLLSDHCITYLLSEWIDIDSLILLDSAVSSNSDRPSWLKCLSGIKTKALEEWRFNHTSMRWLIKRGMSPLKIHFAPKNDWKIRHMTLIDISFPRLQFIDLSGCKNMTDGGLAALGKGCPQLESINLSGCINVTDFGITFIARGCPHLLTLNVNHCIRMSHKALREVAKGCRQLTSISMRNCGKITDKGLIYLTEGCLKLQAIDLSNCSLVSDFGIAVLSVCHELVDICLGDLRILSDYSMHHLAVGCPLLQSIDFNNCRELTNAGVSELLRVLPNLHSANFRGLTNITDAVPAYLGVSCPLLSIVDFTDCVELTNSGVAALARGCPLLTSVNLCRCTDMSDSAVASLLSCCPLLTFLSVASCDEVTDTAFFSITSPSNLRNLDVSQTSITTTGLRTVAIWCPNLLEINLSVTSITDVSLIFLSRHCQALKKIDVSSCDDLSDKGAQAIAMLPNLETLNLSSLPLVTSSTIEYLMIQKNIIKTLVILDSEVPPCILSGLRAMGAWVISSAAH